jgi:hypothetical protein
MLVALAAAGLPGGIGGFSPLGSPIRDKLSIYGVIKWRRTS